MARMVAAMSVVFDVVPDIFDSVGRFHVASGASLFVAHSFSESDDSPRAV